MFIASRDDIVSGRVTDVYFVRTKRILDSLGDNTRVRMEFHATSLPYKRAIFAGLRDALEVLSGKPVDVYAAPEGTVFYPGEPLLIIEGRYRDFAVFEAAVLGILRHYTSVTTKAARIKLAAGDRTVLFFGIRSAHPAIAPMLDRAAYIGGLDGISGTLGAEMLGVKPQGTMPHALIITLGDPVKARKAFDEFVDPSVPRIALADTFYDERYESLLAAETLKEKLYGVRLDTPSSRRGNMRAIVEEIRRTLDIHGYRHVKIFVSGGLDEDSILELRDVADGFGVGTAIARPKNIDISADIVEKFSDGRRIPVSKRGKLPGAKNVYVKPGERVIGLLSEAEKYEARGYRGLLVKRLEDGEPVREYPSDEEIRRNVLEALKGLELRIFMREEILRESPDPDRRRILSGKPPAEDESGRTSIFEHPQVKPIIEAIKRIPEFASYGRNCLRKSPKYRDARILGSRLFAAIVAAFVALARRNFGYARRFVILPMSVALLALAYLSGIGIFVTYFTLLQAYMALKPEKVREKLSQGVTYDELLSNRISRGFVIRYYGFLVIAGALLGMASLARRLEPIIYPVIPGFLHGTLRTIYIIALISIRLIAAGSFLLFVYVVPAILGQVRPFAYRESLRERLGMRVEELKRGLSRRRKRVRKRRFELLQEEVNDLKTALIYARFRMAIDYLPYLGVSAFLFPPSALSANRLKRRLLYDPYPLDEFERGLLVFIPVSIFAILVLTTPLGVRRIFLSPTFNLAYGLGIIKGVKIFEETVNRGEADEAE